MLYAFFADKLFMGMQYQATQIVGLVIVLAFNMGVVIFRLCKEEKDDHYKKTQ